MTPTPHQPDSSIDIEALRQRVEAVRADGFDRFSIELPELRALLDRLERAEAELASVPPFSRAALLEFNAKYCLNKPDLVACAESAFYWFNKCHAVKGAAAGAVPEGKIQRIMREADEIIAAAPPAQGLPAAPDECPKCYGMGILDGIGDTCPKCDGEGTPPAAAPSEPVAWRRVEWGRLSWIFTDTKPTEELAWEPLFAAPPAQDAGTGELYRWISEFKGNALHISRNGDHACNYMSAKEYIEQNPKEFDEDDPAEVQAMIDTDTIWRVQWYPHTPIGFCAVHASTLEAALRTIIANSGRTE